MKKGISLIVLVITIIIIIILAGAVILNLADNNPIENASKAALLSEQSDVNSALNVYLGTVAANEGAAYRITAPDQIQKTVVENGKTYSVFTKDGDSTEIKVDMTDPADIAAKLPATEVSTGDPITYVEVMVANTNKKLYTGKDVEGIEITAEDGYYELGSFTVTCGDQDLTTKFESTSALTNAIKFIGSKYLDKTHKLVMNLGGNLKLVEK